MIEDKIKLDGPGFWTTGTGPSRSVEDYRRASVAADRWLARWLMSGSAPLFDDVTGKARVVHWATFHALDVDGPQPEYRDWRMYLDREMRKARRPKSFTRDVVMRANRRARKARRPRK